jgi:hypothetical protein
LLPRPNVSTGIAGCCARAASGHTAAAPPMSAMNARRCSDRIAFGPASRLQDIELPGISQRGPSSQPASCEPS